MNNVFKLVGILSLIIIALASCSKDDAPKENKNETDSLMGTYKGSVVYIQGIDGETIVNENGTVRVAKDGNRYTFNFSDGIPSLRNIDIENGKAKLDVGSAEVGSITIDGKKLSIAVVRDGASWKASCQKE